MCAASLPMPKGFASAGTSVICPGVGGAMSETPPRMIGRSVAAANSSNPPGIPATMERAGAVPGVRRRCGRLRRATRFPPAAPA